MKSTLQSAYRKIRYIHSKQDENIHPVDVFLEWLSAKMKAALVLFIVFFIGVAVGLML